MMWQQDYTPVAHSLSLSALVAALPIFTLLYLLGVKRKPSWAAALAGLGTAAIVAVVAYSMPVATMVSAVAYGAAFGLFPIGWVVFTAILLFRITEATGKFEIIKDSIGSLSSDRRMQALLIAFAFGAFIEGAAVFGTPVAVAAAMLAGLGFSPFYAAGICLLANTAPVAFGAIATPILTLAGTTGLPLDRLSAAVGRICAPVSLIVPGYLVAVMGGWKALRSVLPGTLVCGATFAASQFLVSNFVGPQLTDILSSLAALGALVALSLVWKPRGTISLDAGGSPPPAGKRHTNRQMVIAWAPYVLLVIFVLLWGLNAVKARLNTASVSFPWPGLHLRVEQVPPVVEKVSAYAAVYSFNWLSTPGTACLLAAVVAAFLVLRMPVARFARVSIATAWQLFLSEVTIAAVLALAFLMNYSGATSTLGLAFAATGRSFPFFSALLGWLGVFLTGSDTSANALFGSLQVVTAKRLGLSPILMAASNSSGGVMGKMISLQSIAVATAATGMKQEDEARLFRFVLRHSITLAVVIGLITTFYAYLAPQWVP
jgi:lactate permease